MFFWFWCGSGSKLKYAEDKHQHIIDFNILETVISVNRRLNFLIDVPSYLIATCVREQRPGKEYDREGDEEREREED